MAAAGLTELRCRWWNPGAGSWACAGLGGARIAARNAVKVRAVIFIRTESIAPRSGGENGTPPGEAGEAWAGEGWAGEGWAGEGWACTQRSLVIAFPSLGIFSRKEG